MSLILNSDYNDRGNIFLGGIDDINNPIFLKENKITIVVSATAENEIDFEKIGIEKNLTIKAFDYYEFDISQFFDLFYKYIEENKQKGNILIYCYSGKSRSTTLLASYMMKSLNLDLCSTIKMIQEKRPKAKPNKGFEKQLQEYEKKLNS